MKKVLLTALASFLSDKKNNLKAGLTKAMSASISVKAPSPTGLQVDKTPSADKPFSTTKSIT